MSAAYTLRDVLRRIADGSAKTTTGGDLDQALAAALSGINPSASATLDFPSTATALSADLTITVTGAVVGDVVLLGTPAAPPANALFTAFVSAADTVTVRFHNYSGGAINPASGVFKATIIK